MSLGYLDPAHTELAVNNALPYRNRLILGLYGIEITASAQEDLQNDAKLVPYDQLGKARALETLQATHCGPFGSDAVFGSVPELTYVTTPSWTKVNRNTKYRIESGSFITASVYDNWYVQHQVPQSDRQSLWVTSSMISGTFASLMGMLQPSTASGSATGPGTWPVVSSSYKDYTSADKNIELDFVGLNTLIVDPVIMGARAINYPWSVGSVTYESMTLGHTLTSGSKEYTNSNTTAFGLIGSSASLNALLNNRHGPYGNSSWKQLRVGLGTHPIIRKQHEENILTVATDPSKIDLIVDGQKTGEVLALGSNSFVIYNEPVVTQRSQPACFIFEDNRLGATDSANNMIVDVSYGNNIDYFSNEELNN